MKINPKVVKHLSIAVALITVSFITGLILSSQSQNPIYAVLYQAAIGGALGGVAMIGYEAYRFICSLGAFGKMVQSNIRLIIGLLLLVMFVWPFFLG